MQRKATVPTTAPCKKYFKWEYFHEGKLTSQVYACFLWEIKKERNAVPVMNLRIVQGVCTLWQQGEGPAEPHPTPPPPPPWVQEEGVKDGWMDGSMDDAGLDGSSHFIWYMLQLTSSLLKWQTLGFYSQRLVIYNFLSSFGFSWPCIILLNWPICCMFNYQVTKETKERLAQTPLNVKKE